MTKFISPSRRSPRENSPLYFPFCGKKPLYVLKDYKGSHCKEIKILFLGCQDLMNVLTAVTSQTNYDGHLSMHLNHSCLLAFARNELILKVISAKDFNVD